MAKPFRPFPLERLARWIFRELDRADAVLGIPKANFAVPESRFAALFQDRTLAAPLGMAAGPHTQLAQNLVCGWLCGARFMELKTVQILDEIEVSRPCIDAADEAYNCEWSQELKLEQSYREYLHAWVLLHALAHRLGLPGPGIHFSMSVGYDLAGIRSPRVRAFLAAMRDGGSDLAEARETVARVYAPARDLAIPVRISNHVTLSTMHGCPPAEIERIARFLLEDLGVHTWVKVNPTLLGPEAVRGLLNGTLGYGIHVPDEAFEHDPRFAEAMAMAGRLAAAAAAAGLDFGLKLTNTLEVNNHRPVFPSKEARMYLSGKALFPLTLRLAERVDAALEGRVPLSFCGGADAINFPELVAVGLGPVTVCTDLLKPGGYARLGQYLANLGAAFDAAGASSLAAFTAAPRAALERQADAAARDPRYRARIRPLDFKGPRPLGAFDCIAAPCVDACPAHQNIPDYLWKVAQGDADGSLEVILRTNPQPGVTGSVCDHPCTDKCVRQFYDAPLAIREIKRFAFEAGRSGEPERGPRLGVRAAVIGAGPAGLSAAYYLALLGFDPEVFEAKAEPGGMGASVIPAYRLEVAALASDVARLERLGVPIHRGVALGRDCTLSGLRTEFPYVFLGVGAARNKRLGIPGEDAEGVQDALAFLDGVQRRAAGSLGARVLVIGGGNSAMDAARSARRLSPDGEVTLVYRRTRAQMPADPVEVEECLEEGVVLRDLLAPLRVVVEGGRAVGLACAPMRLGGKDASGRLQPEPSGEPEVILPADTIVAAISQETDLEFLGELKLARRRDGTLEVSEHNETSVPGLFAGGDVVRGPASIIAAIADGRRAAEEIGRRHGVALPPEPELDKGQAASDVLARKGRVEPAVTVPVLPLAERGGFHEVQQPFAPEDAAREAARCLDCDDLCSLCVTVCPNRANLAYAMPPLDLPLPVLVQRNGRLEAEPGTRFRVAQRVQILNLGDACNDCGNCTPFCPTSGRPYRDKPRFWDDDEAFETSPEDAYRLRREDGNLVLEARLSGRWQRLVRSAGSLEYRTDDLRVELDPDGTPRRWEALVPLPEGMRIDLAPLGTLLALQHTAEVLP